VATGPHQVWSWAIPYLATTVRGAFFYLYLIMAVYSRQIVGWEVYATESAEQAASVIQKAHRRHGVPACVFRRKWPPGPKESGHWF
jgi:transposase InsO family protein